MYLLAGCMVGWWVGWSRGSIGWLVGWLVGLVGWLIGCLLSEWMDGWVDRYRLVICYMS